MTVSAANIVADYIIVRGWEVVQRQAGIAGPDDQISIKIP